MLLALATLGFAGCVGACAKGELKDTFLNSTPGAETLPAGYLVSETYEVNSLQPVGEQVSYALTGTDGKPLGAIIVVITGSNREAESYMERAPAVGTLPGLVGPGAQTIALSPPGGSAPDGVLCLTTLITVYALGDPNGLRICVQAVGRLLVAAQQVGPSPETLPPEELTLTLLAAGTAHAKRVLDDN